MGLRLGALFARDCYYVAALTNPVMYKNWYIKYLVLLTYGPETAIGLCKVCTIWIMHYVIFKVRSCD